MWWSCLRALPPFALIYIRLTGSMSTVSVLYSGNTSDLLTASESSARVKIYSGELGQIFLEFPTKPAVFLALSSLISVRSRQPARTTAILCDIPQQSVFVLSRAVLVKIVRRGSCQNGGWIFSCDWQCKKAFLCRVVGQ